MDAFFAELVSILCFEDAQEDNCRDNCDAHNDEVAHSDEYPVYIPDVIIHYTN